MQNTRQNPIPVVVTLVPIVTSTIIENIPMDLHKVLYIRRGVPSSYGKLAMPGGYIDYGESAEIAASRELYEETGIQIQPHQFTVSKTEIYNNILLIFGITPIQECTIIDELKDNYINSPVIQSEVLEFVIGGLNIQDAAYPLHQNFIKSYLDKQNGFQISLATYNQPLLVRKKVIEQAFELGFISKSC